MILLWKLLGPSNSRYWELPDSISFDCLSLAVDFVDGQPPASLNPGVCAKAAFSYEKSKDLWRIPETKEDLALAKGESGEFRNTAYDIRPACYVRYLEFLVSFLILVNSYCEAS
ncbi:hypothetical protein HanXRQr2_Chr01g0018611 [Helianthus annuus]|uniref:Uncharacterized protein n=1 Tax=Helianthus annuus TaxID=4232 RepID=A0A9K3JWB5_HELAN|nr:hypothetical protein HanXRQr2_Chr01g0018611 [Helianthus annuus]KAJ0622415.1 hypothetical protein HanIR_Chr01g0020291 [Helianthus annuus]KAJ0956668.1 hypothetical protein HanPSC8_Chr01g0018121 [Helianthus annuus]